MGLKAFHIVCIFYLISKITGQCRVELPTNSLLKPRFTKTIGSHIALVSNEVPWIDMQTDEIITAHCDTTFAKPISSAGIPSITIHCNDNQIKGYYSPSVFFECYSLKYNLYESTAPFHWCPRSMISYIVAQPSGTDYEYLAGICYDFLAMAIVSLNYVLTAEFSKLPAYRLRHYTPSLQIKNIQSSFVSRNMSTITYDNAQFQQWIEFANYQYHSLVQNPKSYRDVYQQFGGLMEFSWWTNLRLGNWRLYEDALVKHLESNSVGYDILSGISGRVSAPIYKNDNCQQNRTMVELVDRKNSIIPLYVWQYIHSNNLVVIGINTPFQETFVIKSIGCGMSTQHFNTRQWALYSAVTLMTFRHRGA